MFACAPLFGSFFSESFFQNGIVSLLAVILGIPAGLYLQHLISTRGSRHQREQMRHALSRAVRANQGTLATAKDHLARQAALTFSFDLPLLEATAYAKYDILGDIDLCAAIDHLRFELEHTGRQIDALFRLYVDASTRNPGMDADGRRVPSLFQQIYPQLMNNVLGGIPPLEKECDDVLAKLEESARRDAMWFWQRWFSRS